MRAFLSATYADLQDHRRTAAEAIHRLGHEVVTMELFGARTEEPKIACLREVEESNLLVGIYAHRYGFVPTGAAVSITEQEYNHARQKGKPVLPFFVVEDYPWPPKHVEDEPGRTKLKKFKERVGNELVRDTFSTPDDLAYKVAAAVGRFAVRERGGNLGLELKSSLGSVHLNASNLARGGSLTDVPAGTRDRVLRLVDELRATIDELPKPERPEPLVDPDTLLALAEGLMAQAKWIEAAEKLAEYAKLKPEDWEANNLRGVAFANSRAGFKTNLASLRAYNEAIAFSPSDIDANRKARLFAYRGAIQKRLGRLEEAEADLVIAKRYATHDYEVHDIIYNLAGVFALQREREKLLEAVRQLSRRPSQLAAIRAHLLDYFDAYSKDEEFLKLIGIA